MGEVYPQGARSDTGGARLDGAHIDVARRHMDDVSMSEARRDIGEAQKDMDGTRKILTKRAHTVRAWTECARANGTAEVHKDTEESHQGEAHVD